MSIPGRSALQQVYSELMKTAFAPTLRAAGLRGSGGRFELRSPTHWALLGFQKSAANDLDRLRFTINLSAISRQAWDDQVAVRPYLGPRPSPNIHYGTWADQTRIGALTPGGQDTWWHLAPETDHEALRRDVVDHLTTYAIPWLREHTRT